MAWFISVLICVRTLTMLSVMTVSVALVTDSELDAVLRAAVVACFNILSRIMSGGTQVKLRTF
jgi:hypothetical protein